MKKIKYILRKTPFFIPVKWLAALLGRSSFPLPFTSTILAEPFLDRAISRIGHPPDPERSKEQFYSYFSEIWEDGYENGLHQQYETYLPHIPRNTKKIFVDVGCGAGEFLSFLTSNGIQAIGIDENEQEVVRAQNNNINVIRANALEFFATIQHSFQAFHLLR
ncbi:class I SAM-dependent methyltransferase [Acidithiobacillus marinus]|nr:class I SAM-dependent methyltransferase [Acidithiobacillus marinus]